jgi:hypothetical protein
MIWDPRVVFQNAVALEEEEPDKEPMIQWVDELPLAVFGQRYNGTFTSKLNLKMFPFDTQVRT